MTVRIITGDCRSALTDMSPDSVQVAVTSPPYFGLRDYDVAGQIGLESTLDEYVATMVKVFAGVRRVLKPDGVLFLNLGDSYAGSWGAQSRGAAPSDKSTLLGNGHVGGGPKIKSLSAVSMAASPHTTHTGSAARFPGLKSKDLCGVPWRVAFALQADGWWLRSEIVWAKPNGMPGSQEDRVTSSHEAIFMLSKSERYWSDFDAIKTPPREATTVRLSQDVQSKAGSHRANGGAKTNGSMKAMSGKQRGHSRRHAGFNDRWDAMEKAEQQSRPVMMRDVWFVSPGGYSEAHFAVMPEEIARRCILAGSREGDMVLDPFGGAGTTGLVADRLKRDATLIELSPAYVTMTEARLRSDAGMFASVASEGAEA